MSELRELGFILSKCLRYLASDGSADFSYSVTTLRRRPSCSEPGVPLSPGEGYGCSHRHGPTDILNVSQVPLMDVLERAQCYRIKNVI